MDVELLFRFIFLVAFALAVTISSTYRKRARDEGGVIERKAEGGLVLFLRMVFALPLLFSLLLYVFYPKWLAWSFVPLPLGVRWVFAGVMVLCVPLILWVFRNIGKNISETVLTKENHELVTSGPYHWVRHPLYASALLLICCTSILSTSWFLFAYFVVGVLVFRLVVIPQEEKRLVAAFGDAYTEYRKTTGAIFPKLF